MLRSTSGPRAWASTAIGDHIHFQDPDGLQLELVVESLGNAPLTAQHPEIPAEYAIVGLEGARAYGAFHGVEERFLTDVLGFTYDGEYVLDGSERRFRWAYDEAPSFRGSQGAGSVHHIAWGTRDDEQLAWQERIATAGGYVTDVKDRDYFQSIYFQEPRGVLFEIATLSPGSPSTRTPTTSARRSAFPSSTSTCGRSSSVRCTP